MRALQQFWSRGTVSKIIVLAVAGVIILVGGFEALLISGSHPSGNAHNGSNTTSGSIIGNHTPTATPSSAASPVSTSATTAVVTATAAPDGLPQLGAPLANFTAVYGQPTQQQSIGATDDFWENKQQTVLIGVDLTNGLATHITVVGPPSATSSQTYNSCATFLPPDATSYNNVPPNTYFHSSVGNLVLENDDEGLCMIYVAS